MNDLFETDLLRQVAELDALPVGAYNIRANGESAARSTTEHIDIVTKTDKPGIDIIIKDGTKNESVHIPVIISQTGLKECVYNDFFIGDDCDVTIVARYGGQVTPKGGTASMMGSIPFLSEKTAKYRYLEKHYGEGNIQGKRLMNPTTDGALFQENPRMEMETMAPRFRDI